MVDMAGSSRRALEQADPQAARFLASHVDQATADVVFLDILHGQRCVIDSHRANDQRMQASRVELRLLDALADGVNGGSHWGSPFSTRLSALEGYQVPSGPAE